MGTFFSALIGIALMFILAFLLIRGNKPAPEETIHPTDYHEVEVKLSERFSLNPKGFLLVDGTLLGNGNIRYDDFIHNVLVSASGVVYVKRTSFNRGACWERLGQDACDNSIAKKAEVRTLYDDGVIGYPISHITTADGNNVIVTVYLK